MLPRLHESTRLIHDLDIVPKLDADSWKQLIEAIWKLDTRPRIHETKELIENVDNILQWMKEKYMVALSFRSSSGQAEIDLLVSESNNFEGLKSRANKIQIGRIMYYVASIDDVIEMKQKAGRPQDLLDIETLKKIKENNDI